MKFIQKNIFLLCVLLGFNMCKMNAQSKEYFVYVADYSPESENGVLIYTFNTADGSLKSLNQEKNIKRADYLNISPNQKFLYVVGPHLDGEYITAFATNPRTGLLNFINQQKIEGGDACYVSVDMKNQYALVANYSTANAFSFKLETNGAVGQVRTTINHTGKSVNKDRQNEPHPHMILPAPQGNIVLIPDLGIDKVMIYKLDAKSGKLNPSGNLFGQVPAGGGPRHFAFHPNLKFGYVLNELQGSVTVFQYNKKDGSLNTMQTISILPPDFKGYNSSADIHISPNGKYLYTSNRGHNSISVCEIDTKTGPLTYKGSFSCGGDTPRAFGIDPTGNFILVANLKSHNIAVFKINHQTGFADKVGDVPAQSPQSVKFLEKKN